MKLQVLVSCMVNSSEQLIKRSNLQKIPTLIINQCDIEKEKTIKRDDIHTEILTNTRGLSISRNLAIKNSDADICLISDDDEIFKNDLEKIILNAYKMISDADIIIFNISNKPNKLGSKPKKIKKYEILKVSSVQISFKLSSIKNKIFFDVNLGAGTKNGAGEENKFLLDCYKQKLKIYYCPCEIASLIQSDSTWFKGYDEKYFFNRGKTTRYILGFFMSILYGLYFVLTKKKLYHKNISPLYAFFYLMKGIFSNELKNI